MFELAPRRGPEHGAPPFIKTSLPRNNNKPCYVNDHELYTKTPSNKHGYLRHLVQQRNMHESSPRRGPEHGAPPFIKTSSPRNNNKPCYVNHPSPFEANNPPQQNYDSPPRRHNQPPAHMAPYMNTPTSNRSKYEYNLDPYEFDLMRQREQHQQVDYEFHIKPSLQQQQHRDYTPQGYRTHSGQRTMKLDNSYQFHEAPPPRTPPRYKRYMDNAMGRKQQTWRRLIDRMKQASVLIINVLGLAKYPLFTSNL